MCPPTGGIVNCSVYKAQTLYPLSHLICHNILLFSAFVIFQQLKNSEV